MRCDGEPVDTVEIDPWKVNSRTEFSIKAMVPFGIPDSFSACGSDNYRSINSTRGPDGEAIPPAQVTMPVTAEPNPRGFHCFNAIDNKFSRGIVDSLNRYDLWTQPYRVEGPGGLGIQFQAYYIVKDPARSLNADASRVEWTVELCRQNPGLAFCGVYENNGSPEWDSIDSPFRGALRAINFKRLAIYNNDPDDPEKWCTDVHGKNAQLPPEGGAPCPAGTIQQRIAKKFEQNAPLGVAGQNLWDYLGVSGSLYVEGQRMHYRRTNLDGTQNPLVANEFLFAGSDPSGLQPIDSSGACPANGEFTEVLPDLVARFGQGYCPVGIGFEKIVDERNTLEDNYSAEVSAVGRKPNGQRYNTGLHAPN